MKKFIAGITIAAVGAAGFAAAPALAKGAQAPGEKTVWQIVQDSPTHNTLEFAIGAAGLDGALDASGVQLTLFAPDDAAFEKVADELFAAGLGDGTVGTLAAFLVTNDLLDDVLLYHVTEGRRFSNSVVPPRQPRPISTLLGADITSLVGGMLMDASAATSDAKITGANISASNGVVHVIDNVLVPLG
jgi:uncharacterized surface protein with fasciclin (FAS1) repeats